MLAVNLIKPVYKPRKLAFVVQALHVFFFDIAKKNIQRTVIVMSITLLLHRTLMTILKSAVRVGDRQVKVCTTKCLPLQLVPDEKLKPGSVLDGHNVGHSDRCTLSILSPCCI